MLNIVDSFAFSSVCSLENLNILLCFSTVLMTSLPFLILIIRYILLHSHHIASHSKILPFLSIPKR